MKTAQWLTLFLMSFVAMGAMIAWALVVIFTAWAFVPMLVSMGLAFWTQRQAENYI